MRPLHRLLEGHKCADENITCQSKDFDVLRNRKIQVCRGTVSTEAARTRAFLSNTLESKIQCFGRTDRWHNCTNKIVDGV